MSNIASAIIKVCVVLVIVLIGVKPLTRLLVLGGVAAVGLLCLLVWREAVSTTETKQPVIQSYPDGKENTAPPDEPSRHSQQLVVQRQSVPDTGEVLNSLDVVGFVPSRCREAVETLENLAAPQEERIAAVRHLVDQGMGFRYKGQTISGSEVLDLLR